MKRHANYSDTVYLDNVDLQYYSTLNIIIIGKFLHDKQTCFRITSLGSEVIHNPYIPTQNTLHCTFTLVPTFVQNICMVVWKVSLAGLVSIWESFIEKMSIVPVSSLLEFS